MPCSAKNARPARLRTRMPSAPWRKHRPARCPSRRAFGCAAWRARFAPRRRGPSRPPRHIGECLDRSTITLRAPAVEHGSQLVERAAKDVQRRFGRPVANVAVRPQRSRAQARQHRRLGDACARADRAPTSSSCRTISCRSLPSTLSGIIGWPSIWASARREARSACRPGGRTARAARSAVSGCLRASASGSGDSTRHATPAVGTGVDTTSGWPTAACDGHVQRHAALRHALRERLSQPAGQLRVVGLPDLLPGLQMRRSRSRRARRPVRRLPSATGSVERAAVRKHLEHAAALFRRFSARSRPRTPRRRRA